MSQKVLDSIETIIRFLDLQARLQVLMAECRRQDLDALLTECHETRFKAIWAVKQPHLGGPVIRISYEYPEAP